MTKGQANDEGDKYESVTIFSTKRENAYLYKERINENVLIQEAEQLPLPLDKQIFRKQFTKLEIHGIGYVQTPISHNYGDIRVNIKSA